MENRAHALATGLFVLMLGVTLAVVLWWFSGSREPTRDYLLESRGSVTGLSLEGQVRYRGIAAGKVTDIRIDSNDPRKILVAIRIREDLPITQGTRARLGYQGVTGIAYVQLDDRGENPAPLVPNDDEPPRIPLEPGLVDQLTDSTLDAVKRIKIVADQLTQFFNDENLGRLKHALERLESATVGIDRTFADAPATLAAIRAVLRRLSATLANLEQASDGVAPVIEEARGLMLRLQRMADTLDAAANTAGEGLAGTTLPQLNELLRELTVTSRRFGSLVEEIQASPQMLVVGRSRHPPGPGEDGFEADRK